MLFSLNTFLNNMKFFKKIQLIIKSKLYTLLNFFLSLPLFFIIEFTLKRKINQKVSILKRFYLMDDHEKKKIQNQKLLKIINYSYENIKFYKKFYDQNNVPINKIQNDIKYFEDFPLIDKKILRENYYDFFSSKIKKTYSNCSSGTTGDSVRFFYDTNAADYSSAVTIFCRVQNISKYDKQIHFSSLVETQAGLSKQDLFKSIIFNRENIVYQDLSDEVLFEVYKKIKIIKPTLIHSHPSVMFLLAGYVENNFSKEESTSMFGIFESSGEILENYMAKKIRNVFNCKILNRYGLSEFGIVAYQLSSDQNYLEVINRCFKAESVLKNTSDKIGEIVISGLENFYMPLIKYKSGDLGNVYSQGSQTFIKDIHGRVHDFFYIDQKKYSTHFLMDILDHKVLNIRNFQILVKFNSVLLNLVIENDDYFPQTKINCQKYLPKGLKYDFINDSELKLSGNRSKFNHIVNI